MPYHNKYEHNLCEYLTSLIQCKIRESTFTGGIEYVQ